MAIEGLVTERSLAEAKKNKLSLSAFLEKEDPTGAYGIGEKSDAFQRQLALYDIKVANNPVTGERAHEFGRFWDDSDGKGAQRKLLVGEWMNRAYRAASYGIVTGERLFDAQAPLSYTVYPPTILPEMRFKQIQPSALPFLVARTRTIQTESFRALYLTDTASKSEARMSRVEEGAEIPVATFYTGENASVVRKYGRRLRYTYEQMRRMNIDLVQWGINYVAAVAARDKEDDAIDIIVNGDGNSGTAATSSNGSTYDAAAANKLTLKMLMNYRLSAWVRPYRSTVVIGTPTSLTDLLLLQAASANLAPPMLTMNDQGVGGVANVRMARTTFDGLTAVDNTTVAANTLVFIDGQNTLEMLIEDRADIVETDRVISAQWQEIAMTESIGWAIAIKDQNQILAYTA